MRRVNAVFFAILMTTMSLAGCFGDDDDGGSNNQPAESLDDWKVYMVDSGNDLPNCNSDTLGRLYYVANIDTFEVCLTTGWSFIEIKGADGAQGPAGETGPQGEPGIDGQAANETMMYNLEQQLLTMNQDMSVILMNISEIESDLGSVDNAIQLFYSWSTQFNFDIIDLQKNLSLVWDAIFALQSELGNATSCQLVPYAYCAGADLSGMNLSGMDLTGIDLRGANLQNTTFDYATLDGADLRSIVAMNASFVHTGMNNTYLENAEFNRFDPSGCNGNCGEANLTNAHLGFADLTDADLRDVDLTGALLNNADLVRARFGNADLTGTDFYNSDLTDANLGYANLTNAFLQSADLTNARLWSADLTNAYLGHADLTNADLDSADLTGTDLRNADLTDAYLGSANLTDAYLYKADLTNAHFLSATVTNADFSATIWSNTTWIDGVTYDTNQA